MSRRLHDTRPVPMLLYVQYYCTTVAVSVGVVEKIHFNAIAPDWIRHRRRLPVATVRRTVDLLE